jgi:hypothetical protein
MTETLALAIAQISRLADADQDAIGRKLLLHVERLDALRTEIDKGTRSLDAGKGRPLDIEAFLRDKNAGYGG